MIDFFNTILYQPLFNALVLLYQYLPGNDFGVAIIILSAAIRIALYPLMTQSIKSQKSLSEIQPKLQEIQSKYKDNKEEQGRQMMELYKREKINPLGGCLPMLVQLPILIALYQVLRKILEPGAMSNLYSFVSNPGNINPLFLGVVDLANPNIILALFAGLTQFFQSKMLTKASKSSVKGELAQIFQKQMIYLFPIFTVFILLRLPSAIALYWLITALFAIAQQYLIFKETNVAKS